jgi:hypothetical protein
MAGYSMPVSPKRQPIKELKVQNMNKSPPEYFQPKQVLNNEKKLMVIPSALLFANALVVCSCRSSKALF